eukprot:s3655_g3.t1
MDSSDYGNTEARLEVRSAAPTAADTHEAEAAEEQEREDDPSWSWDNNQSHYWGNHWSYYHQTRDYWGNSSYEPWWSSSSSWWQQDAYDRKADQGGSMPELLPDYVQGWYLLQDAGLTTHERNVVQTALQGDFSLQKVAQELRNQWSGADLLKRESGHRQSGYLGEHMDYEPDDNDEEDPDHLENYEALDPESRAEWDAQEDEAQSAMAAMYQAKRTLREARARQHDVRLSRQYYRGGRGNGRGRGASHGNKDDSGMTCLRCGRQGHRVANCPQPPTSQSAQATTGPEATSSFICYSDHQAPGAGDQALGVTTTSDAVHQGKAAMHHDEDDEVSSVEGALELFMYPRSMFSEAELSRFRLQVCMSIVLWHLEDAWEPFGFSYRTLHRKLQRFQARWSHLPPEELLERAKQEGGMLDIHRSALDSIWHAVQRKLSGTVAANHEAWLRNLVHAPSGSLPDRRQAAHFAEGVVTVYFVDQGLSLSAATKVSIMISSMAEGMLFIRYLWIMMQDLTDRQTAALWTSLLNPQPNGRHI